MGRTSKFTFPVPGRRQKAPAPPPSQPTSGTLTKAQKILGTGELNVDSTTDVSRIWETKSSKSNTGISISVSESTYNSGFGRLQDNDVVESITQRRARWEEESAVLPWHLQRKGSKGDMGGNDANTEASSICRQRSSSTINTYYDSSKVPLSISQQTASSAIAKGLPSKASALLDMNGNYSMPSKPKKKPSRLDLSHLLGKAKSAKHLSPSDAIYKGLVHGPDMVSRSPSVNSFSPRELAPAPPPIQQRTDRQTQKKTALETSREQYHGPVPKPVQPVPAELRKKMRSSASANELHSMYEHYEQRSFQEMMGGETGLANMESISPTSVPVTHGFLSPYSSATSKSQTSGVETPASSLMTASSVKSPHTDCAASVSSRHTRTSKASKRTDRSMTDFDLRQNSVLSLSSDSEDDDYSERPATSVSTSLSAPRRPSDTSRRPSDSQTSSTGAELGSFPAPPSPKSSGMSRKDSLPRHIAPMSPMDFSDLGVYNNFSSTPVGASVSSAELAARASSHSLSSQATMRAHSRQASSHMSTSTVTGGLPSGSKSNSIQRGSMRAIALIPAQGFPFGHRASQLSNASDVPPSPTSIDFYLQSQHNSMAFDNGSVRSSKSLDRSSSVRNSVGPSGNDGEGRFIAVTAQEERLLAALRIKRARMRDKIIAEFEEDLEDVSDGRITPLDRQQLQQHAYQPGTMQPLTSPPPNQPLPPPPSKARSASDVKRSSSRQTSRLSALNNTRLAPLPEQPLSEKPSNEALLLNSRYSSNTPKRSKADDESVHAKLNRTTTKLDSLSLEESSAKVDRFVDFDSSMDDNGIPDFPTVPSDSSSSSTSGSRSRSGNYHTTASRAETPLQQTSLSVPKHDSRRTRIDSILTSYADEQVVPKHVSLHLPPRREKKDSQVSVLDQVDEAAVDIPRPDSPISPADFPLPGASTLPRKKQVRLSAVGYRPMEAGWWADDG
ncbi:hypothetical protein DL546_008527 [Coniochaeta pulveracea]|uniref:Uncharacterized protein n=1 Tax=Coniochaeta pulveracea TaxID=177199 RepID=A0A420YMM8_9PEZI|nr:hypothetical protein DL546_008527 [Coniochaeta pulveracea]